MKTITLKSPDGRTTFELHAYKAGETVRIFKGATGVFGREAGSKTAGVVYVTKGIGIQAEDNDVDGHCLWEWIQQWMQKGMDAEKLLAERDRLRAALGNVLRIIEHNCPNDASPAIALERAALAEGGK